MTEENHTIRLLREMRSEQAARFDEQTTRFDSIDARLEKIEGDIADLAQALAGLSYIAADTRGDLEDLRRRVAALEAKGA